MTGSRRNRVARCGGPDRSAKGSTGRTGGFTPDGFTVGALPEFDSCNGGVLEEALHDNTQTPPDEQAAFRVDFSAWVERRPKRDRRLIRAMLLGERTGELADRFGLTAGRISQLRREFHDDWSAFCGEGPALTGNMAAAG
jgi:hypothetical protein